MNQDSCMESELDSENKTAGRWTTEEHNLFLEGLRLHQKQWKSIADLVKTRTVVQIRTHAQKYFQKMEKSQSHNFHSSEESTSTELNPSEGDDFRRTGYRANSISSTDSVDSNHGKYGRSVSIGSDSGCTDNDFNSYKSCRSGSMSSVSSAFASTGFQPDLLMLNIGSNAQRLDGKQNLRARAVSMNEFSSSCTNGKVGSGVPKKRSREKTPSASAAGSVNHQSFVPSEPARAPKSPKRTYNKNLLNNSVKIESVSAPREMPSGVDSLSAPRGDYFNCPPSNQHSQQQHALYPQMAMSLPSQSYFDNIRDGGYHNRCLLSAEAEEELDMINLLERIDWAASPAHSQTAASPFTDATNLSLSSSSCEMPRFYSSSIYSSVPQCVSYSPISGLPSLSYDVSSFSVGTCSHLPTAEQPDEFDVFDEFYSNMDLIDAAVGQVSQLPPSVTSNASDPYSRTILHQNTINNANISCSIVPFTAVAIEPPQQHEPTHRVSFASVIDEFKAKTREALVSGSFHMGSGSCSGSSSCSSSAGDAYFPISQSFLRPMRPRDADPAAMLPSLSTLTSGASTVVISTSSLTLMDPTFSCNYPLMYGDSPTGGLDDHQQQQQQGGAFGFRQYLHEGGGVSAVSLDSAQDEVHRHYSFSHHNQQQQQQQQQTYQATPPAMSPAAKKRGRPRKFPLATPKGGSEAATVTPVLVSSRSLNSLQPTSSTSGGGVRGLVKITSQPHFPGALSMNQQLQSGKHSFDDFLWEESVVGGGAGRSESLFASESSSGTHFPADVGSYSPKPSAQSAAFQESLLPDEAEALYCDPFQFDGGGDCGEDLLLLDAEEEGEGALFGFRGEEAEEERVMQQQLASDGPGHDLALGDDMMYFDLLGAAFE